MPRSSTCLFPVLVAFASPLLAPSTAEACDLQHVVPSEGRLPAGSDVLLVGRGLHPERLEATVGETPGVVVFLPERSVPEDACDPTQGFRVLALRLLAPTPCRTRDCSPLQLPLSEGQTVRVSGPMCHTVCNNSEECPAETELAFLVTAPDTDAPQSPTDLVYDVYDHPTAVPAACDGNPVQHEISLRPAFGQSVDDYPFEYRLFRRRGAAQGGTPGGWELFDHAWVFDTQDADVHVRWLLGDLNEEGYCFRLQTLDLSSNSLRTVDTCSACRRQHGIDPDADWPATPPSFQGAPRVYNAHCPDEGSLANTDPESDFGLTSGGADYTTTEDDTSSGTDLVSTSAHCACTNSTPPALGSFTGLLVLAWIRRRDRRS